MSNSDDQSYQHYQERVEHELWQALEALEHGDLPTVRSSAARVNRATIEYWQEKLQSENSSSVASSNK